MRARKVGEFILTGLLATCAVAVTGLTIRRELFGSSTREPEKPRRIADWQTYTAGAKVIGSPGAKLSILEFSDFQCPFCAEASQSIEQVRSKYPTQVKVLFRHYPITRIHPQALPAAIASECAADQGKFSEYHDILFRQQASLAQMDWTRTAVSAGVSDTAAFRACLGSSDTRLRVERDSVAGGKLRITGTPTIIVNGWLLTGASSREQLEQRVLEELRGSK